MTVAKLMEILSQYPPDLTIVTGISGSGKRGPDAEAACPWFIEAENVFPMRAKGQPVLMIEGE